MALPAGWMIEALTGDQEVAPAVNGTFDDGREWALYSMTPAEARQFGRAWIEAADAAEHDTTDEHNVAVKLFRVSDVEGERTNPGRCRGCAASDCPDHGWCEPTAPASEESA